MVIADKLVAPENILAVWRKFDSFPMETLTKAWFLERAPEPKQRTVEEMIRHREEFGASGNCFDLAIWLLEEFRNQRIEAYAAGHRMGTDESHVGVVALDTEGRRYLCDLGDLWIQPILIDAPEEVLRAGRRGFFTGAEVELELSRNHLTVTYRRSNGKRSTQDYDLAPVTEEDLWAEAHVSQNSLSDPLVEMRVRQGEETVHWEFENGRSFFSAWSGLQEEAPLSGVTEWSSRIAARTGMRDDYVAQCLEAFETLSKRSSV